MNKKLFTVFAVLALFTCGMWILTNSLFWCYASLTLGFSAIGSLALQWGNMTYWFPPLSIVECPLDNKHRTSFIEGLIRNYEQQLAAKLDAGIPLELSLEYSDPQKLLWNAPLETIYQSYRSIALLGDAGAGKSVLLLQLAIPLLKQALNDGERAIPVIVPLTSWNETNHDFKEWFIEALQLAHTFPKKEAEKQFLTGRIIPFLDNLDTVGTSGDQSSQLQKRCLTSIHDFMTRRKNAFLVLCSRKEAYPSDNPSPFLTTVTICPIPQDFVCAQLQRTAAENPYRNQAAILALLAKLKTDETLKQVLGVPFYFRVLLKILNSTTITLDFLTLKSQQPSGLEDIILDVLDNAPPPPKGNSFIPKPVMKAILQKTSSLAFASQNRSRLERQIVQKFIETCLKSKTVVARQKFLNALKWVAVHTHFSKEQPHSYFRLADFSPSMIVPFEKIAFSFVLGISLWYFILYNTVYNLLISSVSPWLFSFCALVGAFSGILTPKLIAFPKTTYNFRKLFSKSTWITLSHYIPLFLLIHGFLAVGMLFFNVSQGLFELYFGMISCLVIGLLANIREIKPFQETTKPYQQFTDNLFANLLGIPMSAYLIIYVVMVTTTNVGMTWTWVTSRFSYYALMSSPFFSFLGFLYGSHFFYHFILRLCVWLERAMPLRWRTFFNESADLGLLDRVGSGWRFRHQILQDYLMELKGKE